MQASGEVQGLLFSSRSMSCQLSQFPSFQSPCTNSADWDGFETSFGACAREEDLLIPGSQQG